VFTQERDELRALKREVKMSRERKVKKICVWKRKKRKKEKKKRRKIKKEEWQEIYEEDESSER
jgi:hypothetical protein